MESLKDKILNKIKSGEIMQKPRWQFLTKEFLTWSGAILFLAIAALVCSAVIFNVQDIDWTLRPRLHWGAGRFIFINAPYFWIIGLVLFISLTYLAFKHTNKGYRYALSAAGAIILLLSLAAGWLTHHAFMSGRFLEQGARQYFPYYAAMDRPRQAMWQQPEQGLLAGEVIIPLFNNTFQLADINRKNWMVICDGCSIKQGVTLSSHEKVKVIGQEIGADEFTAEEIRPFFRLPAPPRFPRFNNEIKN